MTKTHRCGMPPRRRSSLRRGGSEGRDRTSERLSAANDDALEAAQKLLNKQTPPTKAKTSRPQGSPVARGKKPGLRGPLQLLLR